jgi:hypothetical protein
MIKWWKHHLIPRHMGGSDEPSNLVKCNTAMHVFFHKQLHEEHGKIEDYLAYKGLEGQLSKDEIMLTLSREGGRKGGLAHSREHLAYASSLSSGREVGQETVACPHCSREMTRIIAGRWHFNKCYVKQGGKLCSGCKQFLDISKFHKRGEGLQAKCKECQGEATRQRRAK